MEGLEKELTCPVCLELFVCPVQLPCNHNLCHRYKKMKSTSDSAVNEVPCQLCKPDRPQVAFRSCLDCRASYCEECLAMTHPQHPPFSEHKIVDPRTSFEEPSQTVMCPDHPSKPVEMYCVQDQTPVCLLCEKVGRHKQHNMAALEEVFSQRRAELQGGVDRLEEWLTEVEESLIDLVVTRKYMEWSAAKLKDAIEQECEALHEVIRQRAAEMSRQVSLVSEKDVARVQPEIDRIEDNMQQSRTAIAYAQEALKETDHGCFLQNVDFFMITALNYSTTTLVSEWQIQDLAVTQL
ncbi:PREDICTED: E3 ubiquitin-protein ligase TRIM36-like [Branchiostoma belcheri]|uniref:E3 ubiquitin-protein ligase TRIM36-like n=1 Tax=Branchiostoma belcheri TaxID=7741 RepID=A0A6P5A3E9_BRABE|nr:PREDICTED: E3 ubiquitin-protein ligase TRIM36-like [Branchiostoma belcheri]